MRVTRIYSGQDLRTGLTVTLEEKSSHHLTKVLRQGAGDPVVVFNGDGNEYSGIIESVQSGAVLVHIREERHTDRESSLNIEIGQGISRGDRMDFVLQKSVELGVSCLTPLWTSRCQIHLQGPRLNKRLGHWESVIHSACEQSGRTRIPDLRPPQPLEKWIRSRHDQLGLVFDPGSSRSLRELEPACSIKLLVGPEGGLSDAEVEAATNCGFISVRLGPRILRTETAALASLAAIQTLWGDMTT